MGSRHGENRDYGDAADRRLGQALAIETPRVIVAVRSAHTRRMLGDTRGLSQAEGRADAVDLVTVRSEPVHQENPMVALAMLW